MFDEPTTELATTGRESASVGRPSPYDPEMAEQAKKLCLLGATDDEIADFFNVSTRTIYRWKRDNAEFCQAIQSGKDIADERVERSLYQMATGRYVVEQQAIKIKLEKDKEDVKVVDLEKFLPPEVPAAIFWLKNRRKEVWRDRTEQQVDHTVSFGKQFEDFIRNLSPGSTAKVIEGAAE